MIDMHEIFHHVQVRAKIPESGVQGTAFERGPVPGAFLGERRIFL